MGYRKLLMKNDRWGMGINRYIDSPWRKTGYKGHEWMAGEQQQSDEID